MTITKTEFLEITNKNTISITFSSAFNSLTPKETVLVPASKPRFSEKYNLHKLTLKSADNLKGAKFYAYLRGEKVSFAYSDSPIMVKTIKINN